MAGQGADTDSLPASVGFVLGVKEYDRARKYLSQSEPRRWLVFVAFRGPAILAAIFAWIVFPRLFPQAGAEATTFVVILSFAMPFYYGVLMSLTKPFWRPAHIENDPHRLLFTWVSIRPEGLVLETEVTYEMYLWNFFSEIKEHDEFLYFHHRPFDAVYIPIKAFEHRKDATAFLDRARLARVDWKSGKQAGTATETGASEGPPGRVVH